MRNRRNHLLEQSGSDNEVLSLALAAYDTPESEHGVHRLRRMLPNLHACLASPYSESDFVGFLFRDHDGAMYSKIGMQVVQIFIC
jgi:hypothetical protein